MYCPNCGKRISQSNRFCPYCGFNLNKNITHQSSQKTRKLISNNNIHNVSPNNYKFISLIYICIASAFSVSVIPYIIFNTYSVNHGNKDFSRTIYSLLLIFMIGIIGIIFKLIEHRKLHSVALKHTRRLVDYMLLTPIYSSLIMIFEIDYYHKASAIFTILTGFMFFLLTRLFIKFLHKNY